VAEDPCCRRCVCSLYLEPASMKPGREVAVEQCGEALDVVPVISDEVLPVV
jgi:hypothetical protein